MNQIFQETKKLLVATLLLLSMSQANANNLNITGSSVSGSTITFNISWENSWNVNTAPNNWDAVWVIVKYQDCATREWAHANLSTLAADHTAGSPLQVDAVSDGKGVFIRRSSIGGGNISSTSVTLKMNIPAGTYNYKVLGIEMVNVPAGSFYIGDGTSSNNCFNQRLITSANGMSTVYYSGGGYYYSNIPATFPVGFNSFYCMKYELTQQQYVDFLNTLTLSQQVNRTVNDPTSLAGTYAFGGTARNGIAIINPSNGVNPSVYGCNLNSGDGFNNNDDGQNIACNFLSTEDLTAYLDWAALRPMTELEFEKICRGPLTPITGEFPWGNTTVTAVNSTNLVGSGTSNEGFSNSAIGLSNNNNALTGPVRVGFAATGATGRGAAGATYYGVMEMGGNIMEVTISVASSATTFTDGFGDGYINQNGTATIGNWPTSLTGVALRGGSFQHPAARMSVSDRMYINNISGRSSTSGGRGIR